MADELTDKQLKALTDQLKARKGELETLDTESVNWRDTVELDQQSVGRLSRMDAMQQQEMAQAEARRRARDLTRIKAALHRMEADEYGWCAKCGDTIAFKRLEIDPMATHCIGCAS